jgi:hypothetical protein
MADYSDYDEKKNARREARSSEVAKLRADGWVWIAANPNLWACPLDGIAVHEPQIEQHKNWHFMGVK